MARKKGRPTIFTQELAKTICRRLAEGETLRAICRDDAMPDRSTVMDWLDKKEDFSSQYDAARIKQAHHLFEELLEIADDGTNDFVEKETEKGKVIVTADKEHISRSRLRVDTRKWFLSKVLPKVYGDKLDVTTDGKAVTGISTVLTQIENGNDGSKTPEEGLEAE
jgi:hypothetical protein